MNCYMNVTDVFTEFKASRDDLDEQEKIIMEHCDLILAANDCVREITKETKYHVYNDCEKEIYKENENDQMYISRNFLGKGTWMCIDSDLRNFYRENECLRQYLFNDFNDDCWEDWWRNYNCTSIKKTRDYNYNLLVNKCGEKVSKELWELIWSQWSAANFTDGWIAKCDWDDIYNISPQDQARIGKFIFLNFFSYKKVKMVSLFIILMQLKPDGVNILKATAKCHFRLELKTFIKIIIFFRNKKQNSFDRFSTKIIQ